MMSEWSVEIKVYHHVPNAELSDAVDDLLEMLSKHAAVASYGQGTLTVRLSVRAPSVTAAVEDGILAFNKAVKRTALSRKIQIIVRAGAESTEDLEARLARPTIPDLVGVAELATMLNVSKQRASHLAKDTSEFPRPLAYLAAGPVWLKPTIDQYVETWTRRPRGRPKKVATSSRETHA